MKRILPVVIVWVISLLACDLSAIPSLGSPSQDAASSPESEPAATAFPVLDTPASSTPLPALTLEHIDPVCVAPAPHDPLVETTYEDYPNEFQRFLNAGGTIGELQANLDAFGIANQAPAVASADLTGDGKMDVVVSFLEPNPQTVPPPGALLIYICADNQYRLTHIELPGDFQAAPRILHLQDMNADGAAEVISSSSTCGAHTCFESAKIIAWNGSAFENRMAESTDNLPYPDLQITDYDRDGYYDLEVAGQGFGSVGAGPQRSTTRIWIYDPDSGMWTASEEILGPSAYRIHVLHDAEAASKKGDYPVAIVLYRQVIENDDLLDWMDQENERLNLNAYSTYKLVVVHTLQGDHAQAQAVMEDFRLDVSSGTPQYVYVLLAEAFIGAGSSDPGVACQAARNFASQYQEQILTPLGSLVFGYANPDFTLNDICP